MQNSCKNENIQGLPWCLSGIQSLVGKIPHEEEQLSLWDTTTEPVL